MLAPAAAWADTPRSLAAYVRARAADGDGHVEVATRAYAAALAASPGNAVVAIRAYREALTAGDMVLTRASAAALDAAGVAPADTSVLAVAQAVRSRRWDLANAAADRMIGGPIDFLAPVIKAWVAFERDAPDPAAALAGPAATVLNRRFNAENRALLLIATDREDEGVAAIQALLAVGTENRDLRINAAELLARRGRRDAASTILAGDDAVLSALRRRIGRGSKPSAAFGISRLFTRLAADLVDGEARPLAIALGRAALEIDPGDDRARLVLAGALSNERAQTGALAVLDVVDQGGVYGSLAAAMRVTVLTRAGRTADALELAAASSATTNASAEDAERYGDLLVAAERFDEAAAAYATAMLRSGDRPGWALHLQRGGALEQAGRWTEAEAMLARAVELAPNEAVALNYLGYARVERRQKISDARAMLERAVQLSPDDAAISDSLAWAYFQSGDVGKALPLLERAARAEPADATINEHLGDVYWRLGRRYEARYAWRAAAVHADPDEALRLSGKLSAGLSN